MKRRSRGESLYTFFSAKGSLFFSAKGFCEDGDGEEEEEEEEDVILKLWRGLDCDEYLVATRYEEAEIRGEVAIARKKERNIN